MPKVVYSEAVRAAATKIKNPEFRSWVIGALPSIRGGQRDFLLRAIEASEISDSRLERALRSPRAEDIIREPKRLTLIQ